MTEIRAVDSNQFIELLIEFKGFLLGMGFVGLMVAIRFLIENLTGI